MDIYVCTYTLRNALFACIALTARGYPEIMFNIQIGGGGGGGGEQKCTLFGVTLLAEQYFSNLMSTSWH